MTGILEIDETPRLSGWRGLVWGGAAGLLLLPAVAMRFTREVNWGAEDFVAIGAMLLAACLAFEVAARVARSNAYLLGALGAIGGCFVLVWLNLAVGIIGSEDDPANLLFAGVLLTVFVGAIVARLRARPLAFAMYAAAAVQTLIGVYAAVGGHLEAVVLCLFFAGVWVACALLFTHAAKRAPAAGA